MNRTGCWTPCTGKWRPEVQLNDRSRQLLGLAESSDDHRCVLAILTFLNA